MIFNSDRVNRHAAISRWLRLAVATRRVPDINHTHSTSGNTVSAIFSEGLAETLSTDVFFFSELLNNFLTCYRNEDHC